MALRYPCAGGIDAQCGSVPYYIYIIFLEAPIDIIEERPTEEKLVADYISSHTVSAPNPQRKHCPFLTYFFVSSRIANGYSKHSPESFPLTLTAALRVTVDPTNADMAPSNAQMQNTDEAIGAGYRCWLYFHGGVRSMQTTLLQNASANRSRNKGANSAVVVTTAQKSDENTTCHPAEFPIALVTRIIL